MNAPPHAYTGRFAPSPSGPLHLGSLMAALGSWLDARAAGGRWLLRIEDLDTPRNAPGAEQAILECLTAHGLEWDGPVLRQRTRIEAYAEALELLRRGGHAYPCACSRREIEDAGGVYPGTCRDGLPPGRSGRALRLRCPAGVAGFVDRAFGSVEEAVEQRVGDFILKRADGIFAYQLAVVVDDGAQAITDVVRGHDLLSSTPRQCVLQRLLGLPQPRYLHLPVACLPDGRKLSKQNHAPGLDPDTAATNLLAALRLLGQPVTPEVAAALAAGTPRQVLDWGIRHWCLPPATAAVPA